MNDAQNYMIILYSLYKRRKIFRAGGKKTKYTHTHTYVHSQTPFRKTTKKYPETEIIIKEAYIYQMHVPWSKLYVHYPIKSSQLPLGKLVQLLPHQSTRKLKLRLNELFKVTGFTCWIHGLNPQTLSPSLYCLSCFFQNQTFFSLTTYSVIEYDTLKDEERTLNEDDLLEAYESCAHYVHF